jgi:hypothetical protein
MNKDQWDVQKYKEHIFKKYSSEFTFGHFLSVFVINLVTFSSLDYIA